MVYVIVTISPLRQAILECCWWSSASARKSPIWVQLLRDRSPPPTQALQDFGFCPLEAKSSPLASQSLGAAPETVWLRSSYCICPSLGAPGEARTGSPPELASVGRGGGCVAASPTLGWVSSPPALAGGAQLAPVKVLPHPGWNLGPTWWGRGYGQSVSSYLEQQARGMGPRPGLPKATTSEPRVQLVPLAVCWKVGFRTHRSQTTAHMPLAPAAALL